MSKVYCMECGNKLKEVWQPVECELCGNSQEYFHVYKDRHGFECPNFGCGRYCIGYNAEEIYKLLYREVKQE